MMRRPDAMLPLNACPALVLNADYQPLTYYPLSLWGWQEPSRRSSSTASRWSPTTTR